MLIELNRWIGHSTTISNCSRGLLIIIRFLDLDNSREEGFEPSTLVLKTKTLPIKLFSLFN